MDKVHERLKHCFSLVFPEVPERDIPDASAETVAAWDSVNVVTLAAVIEEEFGISVIDKEPEQLTSFSSILRLIESEIVGRSIS